MRIFSIWILIVSPFLGFASKSSKALSREIQYFYSDYYNKRDTLLQLASNSSTTFMLDSSYEKQVELLKYKKNNFWYKLLWNGHALDLKKDNYRLQLDVVNNHQYGYDTQKNDHLSNIRRGVFINAQIGKKTKIYSYVSSSLLNGDDYINAYISTAGAIPGSGQIKGFSDPLGYPAFLSMGAIEYKINKSFDFSFGQGKHFFGEGYRSITLSDVSRSFPYARMNMRLGSSIHYSAMVGEFVHFDPNNLVPAGSVRQKKYGSYHYLDFKPHPNWTFGFLEGVTWAGDSANRNDLEWNYLNPFAIMRPLEFNLGSPDNVMLGAHGKWQATYFATLYGEILLTELKSSELFSGENWWGNKYALQAGLKLHNFKSVKNLYFQIEYNRIRPFTYSHFDPITSFSHSGQPLAHPTGSNLKEGVLIGSYTKGRFNVNLKSVAKISGLELNDSTSIGTDVLRSYKDRVSDYGNVIGQGIPYKQWHNSISLSYIINPSSMMALNLTWSNRAEWIDGISDQNNVFFIGFRTYISNFYYDF